MDWKETMSKLGRAAAQKAASAAKSVADAASERLNKVSEAKPPPDAQDGFERVVEQAIAESTPSPPQRAKLVGRTTTPSAKPLPPSPQPSRVAFTSGPQRRGWFARTFVDPIARLLGGLARLVLTVLALAVAGVVCLALASRFIPATPSSSPSTVQQPAASTPTTITSRAAETNRRETHERESPRPPETHREPAAKASGAHKESLRERAYEAATGKEVVHRKDGSTYERKQSKKK